MSEQNYHWVPMVGDFLFDANGARFKGATVKYTDEPGPAIGSAICDQSFGGGAISAEITFSNPSPRSSCGLVPFYNPTNRAFLFAGLSNEALFSVSFFDTRWTLYSAIGDPNRLEANRPYRLKCWVQGSLLHLFVDEVEVCSVTLPGSLPRTQVGIWCRDFADITVRDFFIHAEPPRAFVVMQFSSPYNELYQEVVRPVCELFNVQAVRADEAYGPGLILADVVRQIDEAKFIIAEITPANPNVYYEVGYAHARGKPTILIADRKLEKLPFDLSPFRTLFYENSIDGKRRVEEGLTRHIREVLSPR